MNIPEPISQWIASEKAICSAVHFGSGAIAETDAADDWSDVDLHIVTRDVGKLKSTDWAAVMPDLGFRFQAVREATGGVEKLTVVFETGQMDLILVPQSQMSMARWGMRFGFQKRHRRLRIALNEINTCLRSGYSFLKGEAKWGSFYHRVATEMAGVRLDDLTIAALADVAAVDVLWVWQKIARGEYCAAQHVLHRSLAETNFRLLRELRLRRDQYLPSFGLGRRVETLLSPDELSWVIIDAPVNADGLRRATLTAARGLEALMSELGIAWSLPDLPDESGRRAKTSS